MPWLAAPALSPLPAQARGPLPLHLGSPWGDPCHPGLPLPSPGPWTKHMAPWEHALWGRFGAVSTPPSQSHIHQCFLPPFFRQNCRGFPTWKGGKIILNSASGTSPMPSTPRAWHRGAKVSTPSQAIKIKQRHC